MASALERAAVEHEQATDGNDRVLHTTDVLDKDDAITDGQESKKDHLKRTAKRIMHINPSKTVVSEPPIGVTLAPSPKPLEKPGQLGEDVREKGLSGLKDFIHQPVQTIKAKTERKTNRQTAETFATAEISHAQDVELVQAHDRAAATNTEHEQECADHDLELRLTGRQDMYVRWSLDRHVSKIRRLEGGSVPRRERADFIRKEPPDNGKMDWQAYSAHLARHYAYELGGQYVGSFAEPPPASQMTISASIERLLLASTPLQKLIMHLRRIYRWENRTETSIYLALFFVLWLNNLVAAAILLAIVVQVIRRRYFVPTINTLRESITRTEDVKLTALTLGEHIEKRGEQNWIQPMIEDLGPWLLLQLGDMANLFEVTLNFYEWREPRRTAYTLTFLAIACLAFCLTPSWLLSKMMTLFAGITFFGLFPIATRYPDYRLLASPAKWLFWNIPNHAEWAIARSRLRVHIKRLPPRGKAISRAGIEGGSQPEQ